MCNSNSFAVRAEVMTLAQVDQGAYQFSVPCYQRPYVWPDDDVSKLFDDMNEACLSGESYYFIGTTLTSVVENLDGDKVYELIDGQQRTTTLMLLAVAFQMAESKTPLANMATFKERPRLQFDIREPVQHLLGSLAGLANYTHPGHEVIQADPYLKRMDAALIVLKQKVGALPINERDQLATFIYEKVQWVNNVVAHKMDLNRLFATMNTAGVQLEQTDILKSKLLKQVESEKPLLDAIWVACEHLENYFERNLRKVFLNADWNSIEATDLAEFDNERFVKQGEDNEAATGLSLQEIIDQSGQSASSGNGNNSDPDEPDLEVETVYCRSIISFPLLLIHTYRIYRARKGLPDIEQRLHADKLLEIFEPLTQGAESEVKEFVQLLWQVRYQFDRWVVKWVQHDDSTDEQLRLSDLSRSQSSGKWYINRTQRELSSLAMLQCVRYFTGERSAQYWMTPFVAGLIDRSITQEEQALRWLEQIDNELSLAAAGETQKTVSFKQACGRTSATIAWAEQAKYFLKSRGTAFEHYWFQKLEYVLWKRELVRDDRKFIKYRITSKNSVEHVFPQHEEYQSSLSPETLNAFGNLVLLSPGENSSYSNQAVKKKKVDFEAKSPYESLKLKAIFSRMGAGEWDEMAISEHQEEMVRVLEQHYITTR